MTLHIRAAELTSRCGDRPDTLLHTLDQLAHEALDDMRALIFELHPTLLDTHGLVSAVREQAAWVTTARRPVGHRRRARGPRCDIDAEAELDVYRLAQEALHNCVKHAAATHVQVRIGPADDNPRDPAGGGRGRRPRLRPDDAGPGARTGLDAGACRAARRTAHRRPRAAGAGTVVRLVVPAGPGR